MILTLKIFLRLCNMMLYLLVIVLYTICLHILMSYQLNKNNKAAMQPCTWQVRAYKLLKYFLTFLKTRSQTFQNTKAGGDNIHRDFDLENVS